MARFILMSTFALILAGCVAVQRTNEEGEPLFFGDGTPVTDQEFSVDATVGAATAVAPFVGGPFGAAIPIIASLLPLFTRKA